MATIASTPRTRTQTKGIFALGVISIVVSLVFAWLSPMAFGEAWIRDTARLSLAWYWAAAMLMLSFNKQDWLAETWLGHHARCCWLWGIATFWLHLLVAFHYQHHWSHLRAFEHVQAASGWGYGIYVSYFFTLVWTFDGGWWAWHAQRYAIRPSWMGYSLHAFMLFIVFNSTVVFETGAIRWIGAILLTSLAIAWSFRYIRSIRSTMA